MIWAYFAGWSGCLYSFSLFGLCASFCACLVMEYMFQKSTLHHILLSPQDIYENTTRNGYWNRHGVTLKYPFDWMKDFCRVLIDCANIVEHGREVSWLIVRLPSIYVVMISFNWWA
jgi:hypothetical protein